jgi:hypothetical protein
VLIFDAIAEQKIREAIERGELDDLPGQGQPLDLSGDPLVPEDVRMAYRILRNAGFLPPELDAQKEIRDLEQFIHALDARPERSKALRKMHLLNAKLAASRRGSKDLRIEAEYYDRLVERFSRIEGV